MKEDIKTARPKTFGSLFYEFSRLLLKLIVVGIILLILFGYIFGFMRNLNLNMQPAFQDGDLVFYYRIVESYKAGDAVVISYQNKKLTERIEAVAGDTVDITSEGLFINGSAVQERQAIGDTALFEEGVTFPLTVPDGEVFVLGDNRMSAVDSRIFGCISVDAVEGKVIGIFRRRNF